MNSQQEIRTLLEKFQEGYTRRNISQLADFMQLFTPDVEVIGTNGVKPGVDEWYMERDSAADLVKGDWETWGDLRLDQDSVSIHVLGEAGWIAATGTVTKVIGPENYAAFIESIKEFLDKSKLTPEQQLHYILRGGTNTIYELARSEQFVWPFRLTAVVVAQPEGWKFAQMSFSFATTRFPDVRLFD